jgi:hypothetical protein
MTELDPARKQEIVKQFKALSKSQGEQQAKQQLRQQFSLTQEQMEEIADEADTA